MGDWGYTPSGPQSPVIPAQAGIQAEYVLTSALPLYRALFAQSHINPSK